MGLIVNQPLLLLLLLAWKLSYKNFKYWVRI